MSVQQSGMNKDDRQIILAYSVTMLSIVTVTADQHIHMHQQHMYY